VTPICAGALHAGSCDVLCSREVMMSWLLIKLRAVPVYAAASGVRHCNLL
jgi:hypothetical protein